MDWNYITGYFDGEGSVITSIDGRPRKTERPPRMSLKLIWHNTHRESLEAMRAFMGCGLVKEKRPGPLATKPMYVLEVTDVANVVRAARSMLPHALIKKERLLALLEASSLVRPLAEVAPGFGSLAALGVNEVRRLYWDEGMSLRDIGEQAGVSLMAVKMYMRRHDIPRRTYLESSLLARQDPAKANRMFGPERNAKISASRRAFEARKRAAIEG